MNEQDQIEAIAEFDGWKGIIQDPIDGHRTGYREPDNCYKNEHIPDYLHSRDAIVPVIEKQSIPIRQAITWTVKRHFGSEEITWQDWEYLTLTPQQLCEALLRSVGKWKD